MLEERLLQRQRLELRLPMRLSSYLVGSALLARRVVLALRFVALPLSERLQGLVGAPCCLRCLRRPPTYRRLPPPIAGVAGRILRRNRAVRTEREIGTRDHGRCRV